MVTVTPAIQSTNGPKLRPPSLLRSFDGTRPLSICSFVGTNPLLGANSSWCAASGISQRRQTSLVAKFTRPQAVHLMLFRDRSYTSGYRPRPTQPS